MKSKLIKRCLIQPIKLLKNCSFQWFASGVLGLSMIISAYTGNVGFVLLYLLAIIISLMISSTTESLEPTLEEDLLEAEFRELETEMLLKAFKERLNT